MSTNLATTTNFSMLKCNYRPFFLSLALSVICLFTLTTPTTASAIEAAEYQKVINLAGKQRMLTQKMSKEAVLIALDMEKDQNKDNLSTTVALFDKTLKGLKDGDSSLGLPATESELIKKQLDKVNGLWSSLKPTFDEIASKGEASEQQITLIAENNIGLLKEMNRAVLMYEKDASRGSLKTNKSLATTINLSGKQRMLTQKMSKEALLVAYGYKTDDMQLELMDTSTLFDRTLKGLFEGDKILGLQPTSDSSIIDQLKKVENLWTDFKPAIELVSEESSVDDETLSKIAKNNLPLLKEMNKAVQMYESSK